MTIQVAGLLLLCGLLFLISSLGYVATDIDADFDPDLSRQERVAEFFKRFRQALLKSKSFLLGIALMTYSAYYLFSQLYHLKTNSDEIAQLRYKSHAHQVLIGFFIDCQDERYTSDGGCVIKMKQFAEIEDLNSEFGYVYLDLKQILSKKALSNDILFKAQADNRLQPKGNE